MNKKCILATLAGGFALFVLGYVFYGLLLADFFANETPCRRTPNYLALAGGQLAGGGLLALVLSWRGAEGPVEAFKAGAGVGVLYSLSMGLTMFGTTEGLNTMTTVIGDAVVMLVMYGIGGMVVAKILHDG